MQYAETSPHTLRFTRFVFTFLCMFTFLLFLNHDTNAQVLYGTLTGNVTDSVDAAVAGAKVEITGVGTGVSRTLVTDERGIYLVSDLLPGVYKVLITKEGFKTSINERIVVAANSVARFEPKLEVGDVSASVVITSDSDTVLQTDSAELKVVQTTRQINDLPLTGSQGRNYQSLLTIVPGASKDLGQSVIQMGAGEANSAAGNPQRSISYNVNGASRLQNNTRIDGAAVLYPWLPTNTAYVPVAESIQEVNIVTNSYDAEQGLVGGAFVNVITKSGTNSFHGAGWGSTTNSSIGKSRNYFLTTPGIPKDILAQYGYAVGGPIWKNKVFFFTDLERTTRNNLSRVNTVSLAPSVLRPGPNGVDFSSTGTIIYDPLSNSNPALRTPFINNIIPANRISAAAAKLIALLPATTGSGFTNNFVAQGTATFKRTNFDNKINWNPNSKSQVWGRFSYSPTLIFEDPILGEAGGDALNGGQLGTAPGKVYVFGLGGNYMLSSNVIVDAVYGHTLQDLGAEFDLDNNYCLSTLNIPGTNGPDRLQGGKCSFQVTDWANMGNPNTGNPFKFHDTQDTFAVNLTLLHGAHNFRFGLDLQNQKINHFQPQGADFQTVRGTFRFNGNPTALQGGAAANRFNSWASFLLGLPSSAGKVDQLRNPNSIFFINYGIYARDHWQVTPNLTLTYGVRWERYLTPTKGTTGINRFDPTDGNIYTGGLPGGGNNAFMRNGNWFPVRLGVAYKWGDKTVIRGGYGQSTDPRPFIDFRNAFPLVNVWQMPTPGNNPFNPVTDLNIGLVNTSIPPDLTAGVLRLPANSGTTTYPKDPDREMIHSYNVTIERELPWDLKGGVGYVGTYTAGQMAFVNINASAPGTGNAGRPLNVLFGYQSDINEIKPYRPMYYNSLQATLNRRWASSLFGVAYTWSRTINYADNDANPRIQYLPEAERNRGPAGYDRTHNLQVYGVMDLPFGRGQKWSTDNWVDYLIGGWQVNTIVSAMSGTPFSIVQGTSGLNAAGSGQIPNQVKPTVEILGGIGVGNPYFDRFAFAPAIGPVLGNVGRNSLRGPSFYNTDLGLFKTIPIWENVKIQLRGEFLNLFNHANFGNPNGDISSGNFGFITSTIGIGERNMRFTARVSF